MTDGAKRDTREDRKPLPAGEQINRAILDSLIAQIAVLDSAGTIITVNRAWSTFGRENLRESEAIMDAPAPFTGVNYLDACKNAVDDPDAQKAFAGIRAVLEGRQAQFKLEYPCHSPTEDRWFLLVATPLAPGEYSGSGAVISHLDISERRKAEIERAHLFERETQAREIAEAANRSKDSFLAMVSHELRTPLHAILGWVQMLKESDLDAATKGQAIEVIERNVHTQSHLVNDLLDVSRIVMGKMSLEPTFLQLQPVVMAAIELMESLAAKKRIAIKAEFAANPRVLGDAERLQQATWNLIQNAIKFSPEGEEIRVRLEEVAGRARLSVTDSGVGIAPEFLPRVFERFLQADDTTTRRHGGLGLGLTITFQLIQLHQGTLEAFSDGPGKGATFVFELPISEDYQPSEPL